jgi:phytoene dehydrogenase-like protein
MKSDVVVIGAGMAGLATGALLAKQGKRVAVIEKGNQAGGRAYTYEEKGYTLNYGAHAVYRPHSGYLGQVMAQLGREVPRCGSPDNDRSYWADGDRFGAMSSKPHKALTTSLFGMRSKLALAPFMLAVRGAKLDGLGDMTWRAWVDAKTKDAAVRRFAMALATVNTYTRPAGDLAARAVLGTIQRNAFAKDYVGYMYGGWRSMYDAFIDVIQSHDGAVITGAAIDRLEHAPDGSIVAAMTAGERYEAAAFVCTIPPQDAPAIAAPGTLLETELRGWSGLQDVRALTIDLGLSRPVRDDDLTFAYDIERDLYYSIHSETAMDLAPAGSQLLHAMAYLSPEEAADDALLASRRTALVAGLDRFFPGWRSVAVVERSLPNARVVSARATPEQFPAGRVPLRSSVAPNLYFAGDGRDLELNLSEIIFASAMEVAGALAKAAPAPEPAATLR